MYEFIEKKVVRNKNSVIPYTWIRGKSENKDICIMLPGSGYTTQRPLFHYATNTCMNNNVDILHIDYNYIRNEHFAKLTSIEQDHWIYEDVKTVVYDVLKDTAYERYFILSKSIGTIPMAYEWKQKSFVRSAYGIWLTPLIKDDNVYNALLYTKWPSLCVIGDQDPHFIKERIDSLHNNNLVHTIVIPNANHSLEIKGDISTTIKAADKIIGHIEDFIHSAKSLKHD